MVRGLDELSLAAGLGHGWRDAASISDFISGRREFDTREQMVDRAVEYGIGEDRAALARGVALNARRRPDDKWEWAHHFAHMPTAPDQSFGEGAPFAPVWQPLEALGAAGLPVSLIRAQAGILGDKLVAEWRDRLPDSRTVSIAGPHNLHEAEPAELALALREPDPRPPIPRISMRPEALLANVTRR